MPNFSFTPIADNTVIYAETINLIANAAANAVQYSGGTMSGTLVAPYLQTTTQPFGDNTGNVATTQFVQTSVAAFVTGSYVSATIANSSVGNASVAAYANVAGSYHVTALDVQNAIGFTPVSPTALTNAVASVSVPVKTVFGRTGNVVLTPTDIDNALGFTPISSTSIPSVPVQSVFGRTGNVSLFSSDISTSLGYTPVSPAALTAAVASATITSNAINMALGFAPISNATLNTAIAGLTFPTAPVQSVFGRIGNVVMNAEDIYNALGYTPISNSGGIVAPVSSVNGRTGNVTITSADVTTALGYTPAPTDADNSSNVTVNISGDATGTATGNVVNVSVTLANTGVTAGVYGGPTSIPVLIVNSKGLLTAVSSDSITFPVSSVFGRTGAVTLTSGDIVSALGYVPSNLTGTFPVTSVFGRTGIVTLGSSDVTAALGYTPANVANVVSNVSVTLTGDATGTASGNALSLAVTLANSGVTAGTYGSATQVASIIIDAKGRATSTSNVAIAFPAPTSSQITTALGYTPVNNAVVGVAGGIAILDGSGHVPSTMLPSSIAGALVYQGTWDAFLNSPTLANGVGTLGLFYRVANAGTNLGTTWNVGDDLIYDGAHWDKIDGLASEVVSVAGRTGAVTLTASDVPGAMTTTVLTATGDATGTASANSIALTLANSGVTAGTYGSATQVATHTVDAKGRITATSNVAIAYPNPTSGQITTALGYTPLNTTGGTITGALTVNGNASVQNITATTGLSATTGSFGSLSAISGSFISLSASNTGTFAGGLTAATGTFNSLSASTGTFNSLSAFGGSFSSGLLAFSVSASVATFNSLSAGTLSAGTFSVGLATAYTPATGDNTSNIATTAFVQNSINVAPNKTITVSGDATGSGTNAITLTIANSGVTSGTYGSNSAIPVITVNQKGLVTSISTVSLPTVISNANTAIYATSAGSAFVANSANSISYNTVITALGYTPQGNAIVVTGDATGTSTQNALTLTLANVNTNIGTYGSATQVATHTVDAKGRITATSNTAIAFPVTSVFGRTGAVTLGSGDVTGALGYTPISSSFSGTYTGSPYFNGSVEFLGLTQFYNEVIFAGNSTVYFATPVQFSSSVTLPAIPYANSAGSAVVATSANSVSSAAIIAGLGYTPVNNAIIAQANGVATLDSSGRLLASQIPSGIVGATVYQGTWNANTNTPTLTSGTGTKGWLYKVNVAGSTTIDGISQWNVGDEILFDGTTWDKIDGLQTEVVTVAGRTGAVVLSVSDVSGAAPLASPVFTGNPKSTLVSGYDNSTNIATTAWVVNTVGTNNYFGYLTLGDMSPSNIESWLGYVPANGDGTSTTQYISISNGFVVNLGATALFAVVPTIAAAISNTDNSTNVVTSAWVNNQHYLSNATVHTVTGDVTGSGIYSNIAVTLANTAVTAGTYTLSTIVVDSKGRITNAASGTGGGSFLPLAGGTLTGALTASAGITVPTPPTGDNTTNVATTAWVVNQFPSISVGTYSYATVTVNAKGLVTAVAAGSVSYPVTSVAGKTGDITLSVADIANAASNASVTSAITTAISGIVFPNSVTNATYANTSGTATYATSAGSATIAAVAASYPVTSVAGRTGAITIGSSDVTTALGYVPINNAVIGQAFGVAPLNGSGQLPSTMLPSSLTGALVYQGTWDAFTNTPSLANGVGTLGAFYRVSNAGTNLGYTWSVGDDLIYDGSLYDKIDGNGSEVLSVAGKTGVVTLSVDDISGAVSNSALTTAISNIVFPNSVTNATYANTAGSATNANAATTATYSITQASGNNSTFIATTAFVQTTVGSYQPSLGFTPLNQANASVTLTGNITGSATFSGNAVTVSTTFANTSLTYLPLAFGFSGKPAVSQNSFSLIVGSALVSIPANFTGSNARALTNPTANTIVTISAVAANGTTTSIGNVTILTNGASTFSTSTTYNTAAGDVIKVTAPATQDATAADIAITILAQRTN